MAMPNTAPDAYRDEWGRFRSVEDAAMYVMTASGGRGFTTPAREARRMIASGDLYHTAMSRTWLAERGLSEPGDDEPPNWNNWQRDWLDAHPGGPALAAIQQLNVSALSIPGLLPGQDTQPPAQEPPLPTLQAPIQPPPVDVVVEPGSDLEAKFEQRYQTKARIEELESQLKDLTSAIGSELIATHPPGTAVFNIPGVNGSQPMRFYWSTPARCDVKALKAQEPGVYNRFLVRKGRWTLGVVRGGGGGDG